MERKFVGKVVFVVLLVVAACLASLPTVERLSGQDFKWLPKTLKKASPGINPGLDLQGGLRLIYAVETEVAVEDRRDRVAQQLVSMFKEKAEITDVKIEIGDEPHLFDLVFASASDGQSDEIKKLLMEFRQSVVVESEDGNVSHMKLVEELVEYTRKGSVKQAQEKISNRTDALGLENTAVIPRGQDIIVEIPGVDEERVARIKRIISTTARLEFKMVDYTGSGEFFLGLKDKIDKDGPIKLKKEQKQDGKKAVTSYFLEAKNQPDGKSGRFLLKEFLDTVEIPSNRSIGYQKNQVMDQAGNVTADFNWRTFYLDRVAGMTGDYVDNASVYDDQQTGKPYVNLSFSQEGAKKFGDLTGANVERHMAIQLDEVVKSDPVIQEKIGGGQCRITLGGYDSYRNLRTDAEELVVVLKAGALPAPINPVTESTVGPTLGHDSIAMGQLALEVAFIVVLLFMLIYYKGGGVAADIALISNAIFIVGIMSVLGATLTLPGIAGIILTIGMAVDANVIIYERIREELKTGKSPRASVDAGYKRAFWTIFDAQITTFIAGVVMYQYGEKDIKGFAVTLLIGILTSMFSAIFISRICFDWMTRKRAETLSI